MILRRLTPPLNNKASPRCGRGEAISLANSLTCVTCDDYLFIPDLVGYIGVTVVVVDFPDGVPENLVADNRDVPDFAQLEIPIENLERVGARVLADTLLAFFVVAVHETAGTHDAGENKLGYFLKIHV